MAVSPRDSVVMALSSLLWRLSTTGSETVLFLMLKKFKDYEQNNLNAIAG